MNLIKYTPTAKTETVICKAQDHEHKDPHIDIMHMTIRGKTIRVESERGSGKYFVFVNDYLKRANINARTLDNYLTTLSKGA